jgi:hypothetical protein
VRRYEGTGVEIPRLLLKLGPTSLFDLCPFIVRAQRNAITGAVFTTCYIYPSGVNVILCLICFSQPLTLSFSHSRSHTFASTFQLRLFVVLSDGE